MKNENISRALRYYRQLNQYSVNEVSEMLRENNCYAAPKTIYKWENGTSMPNADTLLLLCDLYHIDDILKSFGYKEIDEQTVNLSAFEEKLILKYREHPELHEAIHKLLDLPEQQK